MLSKENGTEQMLVRDDADALFRGKQKEGGRHGVEPAET